MNSNNHKNEYFMLNVFSVDDISEVVQGKPDKDGVFYYKKQKKTFTAKIPAVDCPV